MFSRQIWVPNHRGVITDSGNGGYPISNPSLTGEAMRETWAMGEGLSMRFSLSVIAVSPRLRVQQTAEGAIEHACIRFGGNTHLIVLETLSTPGYIGEDGTVYGEKSSPEDWMRWFEESREAIFQFYQSSIVQNLPSRDNPILVFTQPEIIAAAYACATGEDINPINPVFYPWIVFNQTEDHWVVAAEQHK